MTGWNRIMKKSTENIREAVKIAVVGLVVSSIFFIMAFEFYEWWPVSLLLGVVVSLPASFLFALMESSREPREWDDVSESYVLGFFGLLVIVHVVFEPFDGFLFLVMGVPLMSCSMVPLVRILVERRLILASK